MRKESKPKRKAKKNKDKEGLSMQFDTRASNPIHVNNIDSLILPQPIPIKKIPETKAEDEESGSGAIYKIDEPNLSRNDTYMS